MPPHAARIDERSLLEQRDFLRALAQSLVFDRQRAEDVVQQAWLTALERPPGRAGSLRAWLAGVVRNVAARTVQREAERPARERAAARAEAPAVAEEHALEEQRLVLDAVRALRQPYRTTIFLRYYRDLPPREIAALQGVSPATVKTRLRRGLELLRDDLDRRHGGRAWCAALAPFAGAAPSGGGIAAAPAFKTLIEGLILMNKPILATLSALALVALLSVAFLIDRNDAGGPLAGGPASILSAGAEEPEGAPLAQPDGEPEGAAAGEPAREALEERARPTAADSGAGRLTGRVVDERGRPVAGAEVALVSGGASFGFGSLGFGALETQCEGLADEDGRFALDPRESGSFHLAVGADGFAPFRREIALSAGAALDAGNLALDPGVFLSGRVVDERGSPVAGAEIRRPFESERGGLVVVSGRGSGTVVARTDAAGRFSIARQAVGPWTLRVRSEAHPEREVEGQTELGGERVSGLEIVLERGFEIAGRILGAPPDGTEELRVSAAPVADPDASDLALEGLALAGARAARVAADGSFRLRGLKGGRSYRVQARAGGGLISGRTRSAALVAAPGDEGLQLLYSAPATLVFRVVDARSGAALTDFRVEAGAGWLAPLTDDGGLRTHHPDGLVRFEDLRRGGGLASSGTARLRVSAVGYETFERAGLAVEDGQVLDLGVVHLKPVPLVRVTVLDDRSGAPIEGAAVSLAPVQEGPGAGYQTVELEMTAGADGPNVARSWTDEQSQSGTTDERGVCALTSWPGREAALHVRAEGYAPWASGVLELPLSGDLEQRARLVEGSAVTVRVVDSHGDPLPGMRVEHRAPSGATGFAPAHRAAGGRAQRVSDSTGSVLFPDLEQGLHAFRLAEAREVEGGAAMIQVVGAGEHGGSWQEILVEPGSDGSLTLAAAPRGDLAGRVTEAGLPLAGAEVRALPAEEDPGDFLGPFGAGPSAHTDSKGRYALEGLRVDEYRLEITHRSRAMPAYQRVRVREGASSEDVDLPVAIIEGRVFDAQGEPVAGARVTVERAGSGGPQRSAVAVMITADADGENETVISTGTGAGNEPARTGADGRYTLRGVQPAVPLVVKADGEHFAPARSQPVELGETELRRGVDVTVAPAGSIAVAVARRNGAPAGGFVVTARPLGAGAEEVEPVRGFVGPGGHATLKGCRAGEWSVSLSAVAPDAPPAPAAREVTVVAGESATLPFEVD